LYIDDDDFRRYEVQTDGEIIKPETELSQNFKRSRMTYVTLFLLLVVWPAMSIAFVGDPTAALKLMADSPILLMYLPTMLFQWLMFLLILFTVHREGTGLKGIGFKKIRLFDFILAIGFLFVANLTLSLLALVLSYFGLAIPGEIELLLPENNTERILWVMLSFTAGVCEEAAFRGYLLTRLRILGNRRSWIIPVIVASLVFGMGHTYQGLGGFILLTIYGAMFAVFYIKTKSIWPVIIAHFFQDFSALFFPFQN
jgi:uncharacterized protein